MDSALPYNIYQTLTSGSGWSKINQEMAKKLFVKALMKNYMQISSLAGLGIIFFLLWLKNRRDKRIKIHCNKKSIYLPLLDKMKPVLDSYSPTFWIPSSLLRMAYIPDKLAHNYESYIRWKVKLHDGEVVAVDIHPKNHDSLPADTPTVILLPGFYSDSNKTYCLKFCSEVENILGWRTCVINRRGFGDMPFTKDKFVSYGLYEDIHSIIEAAADRFPYSRLYLVGVSMGAMNIQRYLAEYGKKPKIQAAVAISSPWNAETSMHRIEKNYFIKNEVFKQFLTKVRKHMHDPHFLNIIKKKKIDLGKNLYFYLH